MYRFDIVHAACCVAYSIRIHDLITAARRQGGFNTTVCYFDLHRYSCEILVILIDSSITNFSRCLSIPSDCILAVKFSAPIFYFYFLLFIFSRRRTNAWLGCGTIRLPRHLCLTYYLSLAFYFRVAFVGSFRLVLFSFCFPPSFCVPPPHSYVSVACLFEFVLLSILFSGMQLFLRHP